MHNRRRLLTYSLPGCVLMAGGAAPGNSGCEPSASGLLLWLLLLAPVAAKVEVLLLSGIATGPLPAALGSLSCVKLQMRRTLDTCSKPEQE